MFTAALFTTAKTWKQPKCPSMDEWIRKLWAVCVCVCVCMYENYSAIKGRKILPFATTWVDLECIMLSEVSQTENDKYCTISLICGV